MSCTTINVRLMNHRRERNNEFERTIQICAKNFNAANVHHFMVQWCAIIFLITYCGYHCALLVLQFHLRYTHVYILTRAYTSFCCNAEIHLDRCYRRK